MIRQLIGAPPGVHHLQEKLRRTRLQIETYLDTQTAQTKRRRRRERATEYIGFGFRDTTGHYPRAAVTAYLTYSISFLGSGEFCGVFWGEMKKNALLCSRVMRGA